MNHLSLHPVFNKKCCPIRKAGELSAFKFTLHSSIDQIHEDLVNQISLDKSVYFQHNYLKAVEQSNAQIEHRYVVIYKEDLPISFASFQILNTSFSVPNDNTSKVLLNLKSSVEFVTRTPIEEHLKLKVLVCGNAFITGEHGIVINNKVDKKLVMQVLAEATDEICKYEKAQKNKVSLVLFKDFKSDSLHISDAIQDYGFSSFKADPNLVFELSPDWKRFDDYKNALKAKYRTKLNKALKCSAELEVVDVDAEFFSKNIDQFNALYAQVDQKASFHLGTINMQTFIELKKSYQEDFIVWAYFIEDKMVGYLSAFRHLDTLDAHFIGLDYSVNRTYYVYQRMLYDYVKIALDLKLSRIKFGRTAGEIKSTIGAHPNDLTLYVRHNNRFINKLTPLVSKSIKPAKFNLRKPFK